MTAAPSDANCVSCLTPAGAGAIAVLAVRGPDAWRAAKELLRPRSSRTTLPAEPDAGRFWLGRVGEGAGDEVVLGVPASGPVPRVELHCHGGPQVVEMLLELLERRGFRRRPWQELERQDCNDPLRSAAAAALVEARTARTAGILLDQYQGAFRRHVEAILGAWGRADLDGGDCLLADLARHARVGRHLVTPWRVAVAGAPNVGKSSLVNALAGYQRCVVAATPGTTRDVVTTTIAVDGWPVELADTAGQREGADPPELEGIERAREAARTADVCLWLLDASAPPAWPPHCLGPVVVVVNKIDLPPAWDLHQAVDAVQVSAKTGGRLSDLCRALVRRLVPEEPPAGAAVPFTSDLCARVEAVRTLRLVGKHAEARAAVEELLRGAG